jgi:hypothetical protein
LSHRGFFELHTICCCYPLPTVNIKQATYSSVNNPSRPAVKSDVYPQRVKKKIPMAGRLVKYAHASRCVLEFFRENLYLGEIALISLSLLKSDSWAITFNGIVFLPCPVFSCSSLPLSPFAIVSLAGFERVERLPRFLFATVRGQPVHKS